jgi:hypothetical protein
MNIITINNNMNTPSVLFLDILKAVSMQISIWQWEIHMIRNMALIGDSKNLGRGFREGKDKLSSIINPIRE